jgi:Na+/melibiose symporter-like transporter
MRVLFCIIPALGTGAGLLLLRGYPLTRERVAAVQTSLAASRAQSA